MSRPAPSGDGQPCPDKRKRSERMAKKPKLDPETVPETEPISPPEGPGLIPPPPEPADLPDYGAPQREAARSDVAYTANGEPYYVPPAARDTRTNGHPKPVEPRD